MPGRGLCSRCSKGVDRVRGDCTGCQKPDRLLDSDGRCRWCRERARKHCPDCGRGDVLLVGVDGNRVCNPCALRRHLDRILTDDGVLAPLRASILAAEPLTTRRWLTRTRDLLRDLDAARLPLSHDTLDRFPQRRAAEHLRALLITAGLLEPDPHRSLRRLEARIPELTAPLDHGHRQLATRWLNWKVLPRLRTLDEQQRADISARNAARQIEQVVAFLTALQDAGGHLDEATQHDIDSWFAGPGAIRHVIRPFLTWARQNRQLPRQIELPPTYVGKPVTPMGAEQRWQIARRLTTDNTIDPADRIAAAPETPSSSRPDGCSPATTPAPTSRRTFSRTGCAELSASSRDSCAWRLRSSSPERSRPRCSPASSDCDHSPSSASARTPAAPGRTTPPTGRPDEKHSRGSDTPTLPVDRDRNRAANARARAQSCSDTSVSTAPVSRSCSSSSRASRAARASSVTAIIRLPSARATPAKGRP